MRKLSRRALALVGAAVLVLALVAVFGLGEGDFEIGDCWEVDRLPSLSPDYRGIRIPYNIAPLNFVIQESGSHYQVRFRSRSGEIVVSSREPEIRLPQKRWREFLLENRGEKLEVDVYVDVEDVGWKRLRTVVNEISDDPIDPYLVYRDIHPQFYVKAQMCLRERSIESFDQRELLDSRQFPRGGCVNCHSFHDYRGDRFVIQVRYGGQNYMLLSDEGRVSLIQPVATRPGSAYLSWHPSGKALAITVDMGYMIFNLMAGAVPEEMLEYGDTDGDIGVYRISENRVSKAPAASLENRVETQPAWSPDGKYLYFVSAPRLPVDRYADIQYDLRRVSYDIETDTWGESETLISAPETGMSCSFPKVSPDGRFLLFCVSDRSSFTILRSRTDLYMMDLADQSWRKLEINSNRTDSYHCWSSNSRWFGFVSKRRDGVHGLVYFCHVDEDGSVSKPFILPQRDPRYYQSFLRTFNAPEFVREPVNAGLFELGREANATGDIIRSE